MLIVKRRHVIGHREHGLRPAVRGRIRAASPQGAGPDKARAPAVHSNSTVYPRRPTPSAADDNVVGLFPLQPLHENRQERGGGGKAQEDAKRRPSAAGRLKKKDRMVSRPRPSFLFLSGGVFLL